MNEENTFSKKQKFKNPSKRKFMPLSRRQENISPKKYSKTKTRKMNSEVNAHSLIAAVDNNNNISNINNTNLKSNTQFNLYSNLDINSNSKPTVKNKPKNINKAQKINKYSFSSINSQINNYTYDYKTNNNNSNIKEYKIFDITNNINNNNYESNINDTYTPINNYQFISNNPNCYQNKNINNINLFISSSNNNNDIQYYESNKNAQNISRPKKMYYNKSTNLTLNGNIYTNLTGTNINHMGNILDNNLKLDQQAHNNITKRYTDSLFQKNIPFANENDQQYGDNNVLFVIGSNNKNNYNINTTRKYQEESKLDEAKIKLYSSTNVLRQQNDSNMIEKKPSKKKMTDTDLKNMNLNFDLSSNKKPIKPFIYKPPSDINESKSKINNYSSYNNAFYEYNDNNKKKNYYYINNDFEYDYINKEFILNVGDNNNNSNIKKTRSKAKTKIEEKNEEPEIEIRIIQNKSNNYNFYNSNNCTNNLTNDLTNNNNNDFIKENNINNICGINYYTNNYSTEENQKNNGINNNNNILFNSSNNYNINNQNLYFDNNQTKTNKINDKLSQTEKQTSKTAKVPFNDKNGTKNNIEQNDNNFFDFNSANNTNTNINSVKNLKVKNCMANLNNTHNTNNANSNTNQNTPNINEIKKNHTNSPLYINNSTSKVSPSINNINTNVNNLNAQNLIGKIINKSKLINVSNNNNKNSNNNNDKKNEIINIISKPPRVSNIKENETNININENDLFAEKMNHKKNNNNNIFFNKNKKNEEQTENSLENSSSFKIISYHEDQIDKISSKKVTLNNEKSNDEEESEMIPQVSEFSKEYFNINNDPNKYNFYKNIYQNNFDTGNNNTYGYVTNSDNMTLKDASLYSNYFTKGCKSLTQAGTERTGHRKKNQDNYIIEKNVNGIIGFNLFGILDGHGVNGHYASEYVSKYLIKKFLDETNNFDDIESLYKELKKDDFQKIIDIFLETDKQIIDQKRFDVSLSGTTCVLTIQLGDHLICSNIGDSRAILIYGDSQIFELSHDSKPELPEESKRISMMGGVVSQREDATGDKSGPYRVYIKNENEPGLAMSRSFGDKKAKSCGVIPYPDIIEYNIDNNTKYMVICSDGVWEFLSNHDVMNIGNRYYNKNNIDGFCQELLKKSTDKWKQEDNVIDDITMIVVFF